MINFGVCEYQTYIPIGSEAKELVHPLYDASPSTQAGG
jgi:hypothetical protein